MTELEKLPGYRESFVTELYELESSLGDLKDRYSETIDLVTRAFDEKETVALVDFFKSIYDRVTARTKTNHERKNNEQYLLDVLSSAKAFVDEIDGDVRRSINRYTFKKDVEERTLPDRTHEVDFTDWNFWKELSDRFDVAKNAFTDAKNTYHVFVEINSGELLLAKPDLLEMRTHAKRENYRSALKKIRAEEERKAMAYAHLMTTPHPGI